MENYENICYLDCPHFTVGHVDQWGERGYLLYDGKVYWYEEDRKEQCGTTRSPVAIKEFLALAEKKRIQIPEDFLEKLMKAESKTSLNKTISEDMEKSTKSAGDLRSQAF